MSALAHNGAGDQLIGRAADVGYVTPENVDEARSIVETIQGEQEAAGEQGKSCTSSQT